MRTAGYYNVQLHRDGSKILTAWPRSNRLRLAKAWCYRGKPQTLSPGTYTRYVWRGSLARPRYGPLLGSSRFVVKR